LDAALAVNARVVAIGVAVRETALETLLEKFVSPE
jgi:hypothetical protein